MTKRLGVRCGLVLLVVLLAVGPVVLTTQAGNVFMGGAHWARRENPFELRVGDNVGRRWNRVLETAARDWGKSRVVNMRVAPGSTSPSACQPRNGQVQVCTANYGNTGWLGLATIWVNKKRHIVRATVQLNDFYFRRGYYNKPKALRHTMCHELGHTLGLDHAPGRSCLNDTDTSVFRDVRPAKRDFRNLRRLYRHDDSRANVRSAEAGDGVLDVDAVPELPTDETLSTSESVHAEATGDGGQVIRFITWTDEAKSR